MKDVIMIIVICVMFTILICWASYDNSHYTFECTDYQGNIIYCVSVSEYKNELLGTLEDGTVISITSYKRVLKEEVK